MCTLPKMIDVIAALDGRDPASLKHAGRVIREAGLIPTGKRGSGAQPVGLEHATTLLLGIFGSGSPSEAPHAALRLRTLEVSPQRGSDDQGETSHAFADVAACETFGEAVQELIVAVPDILQAAVIEAVGSEKEATAEQRASLSRLMLADAGPLRLRVALKAMGASIECRSLSGRSIFERSYVVNDELFMGGLYGSASGDRRVVVSFTLRTLWGMFDALLGAD